MQADPIILTMQALPVQILLQTKLSTHHLWSADHFASLVGNLEAEHVQTRRRSIFSLPHRAYVMASLSSAAAFLEALVNELFIDIGDELRKASERIPALSNIHDSWRKETMSTDSDTLKDSDGLSP